MRLFIVSAALAILASHAAALDAVVDISVSDSGNEGSIHVRRPVNRDHDRHLTNVRRLKAPKSRAETEPEVTEATEAPEPTEKKNNKKAKSDPNKDENADEDEGAQKKQDAHADEDADLNDDLFSNDDITWVPMPKKTAKSSKKGSKSFRDTFSPYPTPTETAFPTLFPTATLYPTLTAYPTSTAFPTEYYTKSSKKGMGGPKSAKSRKAFNEKGSKKKKSAKERRTPFPKPTNTTNTTNTTTPAPTPSTSNTTTPPPTPPPNGTTPAPTPAPSTTPAPTPAPNGTTTPAPTPAPNTTNATSTPAPTPAPNATNTTPAASFALTLDLASVPANFQTAFTSAAAKWQSVITGDLEDIPVDASTRKDSTCTSLPSTVDDVFICAFLTAIDGPQGVLGSAGPEYARFGKTVTPSIGYMEFDTADAERLAAAGQFASVVLHEMGHVLGIGTLWSQNNLAPASGICPYKQDSFASAEYRALSGCTGAVPIEYDGGEGTACGHWDEQCLKDELMTGTATGSLPLSRITIGGLADLGYSVNYAAADPYTKDNLDASCRCNNIVGEDGTTTALSAADDGTEDDGTEEGGTEDDGTEDDGTEAGTDDTSGAMMIKLVGPKKRPSPEEQTEVGEGEETAEATAGVAEETPDVQPQMVKLGKPSHTSDTASSDTEVDETQETTEAEEAEKKSAPNAADGSMIKLGGVRVSTLTTGKVGKGPRRIPRRRLSEQGLNRALEYGHAKLVANAQRKANMDPEVAMHYVGDSGVMVLYMEHETIFAVKIWNKPNQ